MLQMHVHTHMCTGSACPSSPAQINMFAALMVCVADIFMFATIFSYFVFVRKDDDDWEFSQF